MKQLLSKHVAAVLLLLCTIAACRKAALQPINESELSTTASSGRNCADCAAKATATDVTGILQTYRFKEGANLISSLADGTKIIAQVSSGKITQWILQSPTGKQHLPQSTEMMARRVNRFGTGLNVYRICFYLDGLYNCWFVIKNLS